MASEPPWSGCRSADEGLAPRAESKQQHHHKATESLYDLGSPADVQSSTPGCLTTDASCVNMGYPSCGHRGRCHGEWGSVSCQCMAGFAGQQCEEDVPEYSFDGRGHTSTGTLTGSTPLTFMISQGLLCVFYNLGDGNYDLTLPAHRLDNGEWHEVLLDRHDNEMTLRLDGGGGRREVTGSRGRSKEIVVDTAAVTVGNSLPPSANKSFQGCMRDLRINGRFVPMDGRPRDGVSQVSAQGLSPGCPSDSCKRNQCAPPFTCVDLWRVHECRKVVGRDEEVVLLEAVVTVVTGVKSPGIRSDARNADFLLGWSTLSLRCPVGHMVRLNGTRKSCVYTLCATHPCHRGACVAHSPTQYTCHCPDGYRGPRCETALPVYREDVGLSFSSLFAICICFMALLACSPRPAARGPAGHA
ncbi:hypothetical protein CRUP_005345 [Coryphaenoides rupestris]|nr:hypothetical protein CRUP_005345 [Coryphaenoides rupestris]